MVKKEKAKPMSMAELSVKFGGNAGDGMLPSQSEGKEFGKGDKGKGKGKSSFGDSRADDGDDWRGGKGGDRDGGKGGGFKRRDEEPSRSDTGDWFSKDKPAGGGDGGRGFGGGDRGGGGGFRDRDGGRDGGDRPPRRERESDNGPAGTDDNWRSGMGGGGFGGDRDRRDGDRGGFGGRRDDGDRGGRRTADDDNTNWRDRPARDDNRGGRDDAPRERPKLQLTKKGEKDAPKKETKEEDAEDEPRPKKADPFGATGGKYVPPSQRSRERDELQDSNRDEAVKRKEEQPEEDDGFTDVKAGKNSGRAAQDDTRKQVESDRRKGDDEHEERPSRNKESAPAGGKYVPAHMRKEVEQKQKKEEEQRLREEKEEEKQRLKEKEREEKKAAERAAKEAEKQAKKTQKDEPKVKANKAAEEPKKKASGPAINQEKLRAFGEKCKKTIENAGAKVSELVKEVPSLLSNEELKTIGPVHELLQPLLIFCRGKEDKQVVSAVGRFAPLLNCLIEKAEKWRFKVQLLCEAQKVAYEMGLPRLSPASALIEVFFDGLYQAEVIEEKYFELWTMSNDDTIGKTKAMFQMNDFLDWLRTSSVEGETDSEEEDKNKDKGSDDEDEDEEESDNDEDIEANVPKRAGLGRPIR